MAIGERPFDSLIGIRWEFIGKQGITLGSEEMQFMAEIFPLLRSHLCGLQGVSPCLSKMVEYGMMRLPREEQ
jgi:hypothetical protein